MQQKPRAIFYFRNKTVEGNIEHFKFTDDGRIMTFLRGCKFSLEKTKRKLDMYFTMRTAVPEFFADRDPTKPEIQEVFKIA